jgi:hypothetical protein
MVVETHPMTIRQIPVEPCASCHSFPALPRQPKGRPRPRNSRCCISSSSDISSCCQYPLEAPYPQRRHGVSPWGTFGLGRQRDTPRCSESRSPTWQKRHRDRRGGEGTRSEPIDKDLCGVFTAWKWRHSKPGGDRTRRRRFPKRWVLA